MLPRRALLKAAVPALASLALLPSFLQGQAAAPVPAPAEPPGPTGPFTLPPLPYAYDALEPFVDAKTMEIHYTKHHAAYVKNANKALAGHPELQGKGAEELLRTLDTLPEELRAPLRNNLGGHVNHSWFWTWMRKGTGAGPASALANAIERDFGGYPAFRDQFTAAALTVFGSGWAWLTVTPQGTLAVEATSNQDNPLMTGRNYPILGLDVWEHAYYLKHQNVRADYVKDFLQVVNWTGVQRGLESRLPAA